MRARAVQFSACGAVIAVYFALFGVWALLAPLGFGGTAEHAREAIVSPILLALAAAAVLGTLARAPQRLVVLAAVDVAAASVGLANLLLIALRPSFWTGSFLVLFAVSPALLVVGAVLVVLDRLRQGASRPHPRELRVGLHR